MNVKDYSKKRLYSVIRSSIIGLANVKVFSYLLNIFFNKDELEYDELLLKIFNVSKNEYDDFNSFEAYPRDCITSKPSFYTLNRNDMCNIIKNVILKLHEKEYLAKLKEEIQDFTAIHPNCSYFSHSFILKLYDLRTSEYNEIINFEESLFLQGNKDSGLSELNEETKEMIKKFLIKC